MARDVDNKQNAKRISRDEDEDEFAGESMVGRTLDNPFLGEDEFEDIFGSESQYISSSGQNSTNPFLADTRIENSPLGSESKANQLNKQGTNVNHIEIPLRDFNDPTQPESFLPPPKNTFTSRIKKIKNLFKKEKKQVKPEDLGPRQIILNDYSANHFLHNAVSTCKYSAFTFLPKFLKEQFSKYANLFFLFTAVVQQIPGITPVNRYTTIGPMLIVLSVSGIKEIMEDIKRKKQDQELNESPCYVLQGTGFVEKQWKDVVVGDIVKIVSETFFPADLVLLSSSEPEGLCYIETANLDGETNLKIKQALPETAGLLKPVELGQLSGEVKSEQPNNNLYTFDATLKLLPSDRELPLSPDQLLLRGAQLRNTPWVYGIVVFTGHESKLMKNTTETPIKRTSVEKQVNSQILFLLCIFVFLCFASSLGALIHRSVYGSALSYVKYTSNRAGMFFKGLLTFWILYSNLVPISLFVTFELVRYIQAQLISSDLDMYNEETDTPAACRTSSLVEELGQVGYIFSDKTGTLTRNQMEFRQCTIAGVAYADVIPEDRQFTSEDLDSDMYIYDFDTLKENLKHSENASLIHQFLLVLSICHTVIPEYDESTNSIKYQASSPDEGALVKGAASIGYKFLARKPHLVTVSIFGKDESYELLHICEFNSTRKRMSIVFRCPDGKIRLYVKGADTVIMERLASDNPYLQTTIHHLEDYATVGLRTLCIAMREVPEDEYQRWSTVFETAASSLVDRAQKLMDAAEEIEKDLILLGATAIEDRLQDGVPDTISTLQTAGIKIWVLTGDRQETAINIGMSCKLIDEDMGLVIVNEETKEATAESVMAKLSSIYRNEATTGNVESMALVIDGVSLTYALDFSLERRFFELASLCRAVICCRVSPLQKALIVKMVKRNTGEVLLAIGDGANDVPMIQAAHVGVGISGMEGLQAVRSSDFSISQFCYLKKLLLVHGSWCYQRLSKLILYSFYKNIALYMTQFWYAFCNAFSGQVIFESWSISLYNVLFTVLPPVVIGIFDQFVSAGQLFQYPQLYQLGQRSEFFNLKRFWSWITNGFYHSLLLFLCSIAVFYYDGPNKDGLASGHWVWGTTLYAAILATVLGKAALISNHWTQYTVIATLGSFLLWIVFMPIYAVAAPAIGFSKEYYGIIPHLYGNLKFWASLLVLPTIALMRDFVWKYSSRMYYPEEYHYVQEIQKYNVTDYRPRIVGFHKAIRKIRQMQRMRKQRGYAFSQGEEDQSRILDAYDTTHTRGAYGEMR
ncbi:P-type ATPase [Schizosaccharomyces pombe]|uniref:Phospholipid-transporting ATPase C887.12 n=1 Tax=Schizosaccharomyces pombe (strain 972 / ATCC 24843) TaxID=284812 RepID=ATC3_SCHPO|nr:putative P-type ATPase [Schizosaccharomyces pombe]O94296.1 RecName: Full=Phospholipid-transporting ATPase C887.12 [Schizosaccharomyces pombe 972h-]CAA21897.1 P-type ATPase (predicted) [Schizosaccharomyces pombe]|eukprot:NP_596486.1 putative P-type ATPase [Schizosaccharomyces pombe]